MISQHLGPDRSLVLRLMRFSTVAGMIVVVFTYALVATRSPSSPKILGSRNITVKAATKSGQPDILQEKLLHLPERRPAQRISAPGNRSADLPRPSTQVLHTILKTKGQAAQKVQTENTGLSELNQADLSTLKSIAYNAMQAGKNEYAVQALIRAVKLNPNDRLARQYLAYALVAYDDPSNALKQFQALKMLASVKMNEQIDFASALATATNKEPAEKCFDQIIRESANDGANLLVVTQKCKALGLMAQAVKAARSGMKSGIPELYTEFKRLDQELNKKKEMVPKPDTSVPKLS